ncbi:CPBP family intramembrane metalloprotease [Aquimarina sp. TRL1]|uniref:CPBP family glutamic-type intramembrane protease n=1 Tax=Aquimarina sp. (strain TRL1) TaxID=2736252 RepID=UPI001589BE7B|nr:CPBP family intramembrane metalloprotease [Aquimarina sp. TRL1]
MITSFFKDHFNRYNIDNRKARVFIPSLFIAFIVFLFCISIILKKIFPFEVEEIVTRTDKDLNVFSTTFFLVFTAIMEEFKYRGLLTKFNYKLVIFSLALLGTNILFLILKIKVHYLSPDSIFPMLRYIIMFSITTIVMYFILFKTLFGYQRQIKKGFNNYFNLILWMQVILFTLWHIFFSGQANERHVVSIFIMTSISALFFTYIRINYGVLYSIIVHFFYNFLISVFPIILIKILQTGR